MKLIELNPRWLVRDNVKVGLVFLCPHCRKCHLTCKFVPMGISEQGKLSLLAGLTEDQVCELVPARKDFSWTMSGESFDNINVTPSIDASKSGHWHGYVTSGEIK